jgi:hypothetical protein
VTFSVGASGTAPLTYQWRFNAGDIAGAAQSSLVLSNVQMARAGGYSVVVGNSLGSVTSSVAVLSVNVPPPPAAFDASRDFSSLANPSGAWSYGWKGSLGGVFNLLTVRGTVPFDNGVPVDYWRFSSSSEPAIFHNGATNTAISNGGQGVHPPGALFYFGGPNGTGRNFGVLRFTAPAAADYQLETAVKPYLNGPPQGDTDFHVVRNGVELFGTNLAVTATASFNPVLSLNAGDTIDLAIGRGADDSNFGSGLDITARITVASTNSVPAPAGDFILTRDYSATNNPAGPWSYGAKPAFNGPLSLFGIRGTTPADGGVPIQYWQLVAAQESTLYHNGTTNTATLLGGEGVLPPGTTYLYSGATGISNAFGAVRFTAPVAGNYSLQASARPVYNSASQGDTDYHVVRNGLELFGVFLAGQQPASYSNTLALAAGDRLDFMVGRGADNSGTASGLKLEAVLNVVTNTPPPATNCVLAAAGLSAWLPLDGNAQDASGGSPGVLNGSPAFASAKVAQGLRFDGLDDSLRLPASAATDLGAGSGATIEMWINPQQVTAPAALLEWSSTADPQPGLHFYSAVGGAGTLFANLTDTNVVAHQITSPPGVLSTGVFQHVALTYNRTSGLAHLYVNAVPVASNAVGNLRLETRPDLWLGQRILGGTPYRFSGVMDEVSLYQRALSEAELQAIYQAGAGGKCRPTVTNPPPLSPSGLRVVNVSSPPASVASVPVEIAARGDENACSFSLAFNPALLSFGSASAAGLAGSTLIVNSNDAGAGRIGIALALPAGSVLARGTQVLMRVEFQTGPTPGPAPLGFGGAPVAMQVADALARPVPAVYAPGTVTIISTGFEADVAPRPEGDGIVVLIDLVQVGRFAANLDTPGTNEFSRIDCAPRSTGGNGVISTADFVQAGRYVAALDPLTPAGGPVAPGANLAAFQPAADSPRRVSVAGVNAAPAAAFSLPVLMDALGDENALGVSIVFDPAKMTFAGAASGADAASASLSINANLKDSGKLGFVLALSPGRTFSAGRKEMLRVNFVAAGNATGNGIVSFGDEPVLREVASAGAEPQPASFSAGTVVFGTITPPGPQLFFTRSGDTLVLAWTASATAFELEGTAGPFGTPWATISSFPFGDQKLALVPISSGQRFFRLKKP